MNNPDPYNLDPYGVSQPSASDAIPANPAFAPVFPPQMGQADFVPMPFGTFADHSGAIPQPGYDYGNMSNPMNEGAGPSTGPTAGPSHASMEERRPETAAPEGVRGVSEEMKDRRRQKNRASQAAFRERRKQQIKGLEDELSTIQTKCDGLNDENGELRELKAKMQGEIERLEAENQRLRTSLGSSPVSDASGANFELPRTMEPPLHPARRR